MAYKKNFPDISIKLYWRVHSQFTKIVSYKLRTVLERISENRKLFSICETNLLYIIATTLEKYGGTIPARKDLETIKEMIEAIEKHGEIELFYEY
jgi:hypothetical protein